MFDMEKDNFLKGTILEVNVKNTFLSIQGSPIQSNLLRCNSDPSLCSKIDDKRHSLKIDNFLSLCDTTDTGSSGLASRSSISRRPWDEYSVDDNLSPLEPCTPRDVSESTSLCGQTIIKRLEEASQKFENESLFSRCNSDSPYFDDITSEDNESLFNQSIASARIIQDFDIYNNFKNDDGGSSSSTTDCSYGYAYHHEQYVAVNNDLYYPEEYTTEDETKKSGRRKNKSSSGNRKRKNRWVFENRKNKVHFILCPNSPNYETIEQCQLALIGYNGINTQWCVENCNGAFVKVDIWNPVSLSIKVSAPFVESFMNCRKNVVELVESVFPECTMEETDEGTFIKNISLKLPGKVTIPPSTTATYGHIGGFPCLHIEPVIEEENGEKEEE